MDYPVKRKMRIAVTLEEESWIVRRLAERFMQHAGEDCEMVPVPARETIPEDVDAVLYSEWPHSLLQPRELRRKIPAVMMVHHIDRFAFRLRFLAMQPDVIVTCMSQRWVRFLRWWMFPRDRVVGVNYGVDLELFRADGGGISADERVCIGIVGRLYPGGRKGEDRLLAIARQLSPQKFRFQFMGERWDEVIAELRGRGFSVEIARRVEEAEQPAIYRRMDCLLVCSRNEGGPLPVLEALASGVPVISTDVGFLPELQERLPFAVRIFKKEDEAVTYLERGRKLRREAQGRCAEMTAGLQSYSWPHWARRMKELLIAAAALRSRS